MGAWIAAGGGRGRAGGGIMQVMSAVVSPWVRLSGGEPYVLAEDKPVVDCWNARLSPDDPRRLELHVLPEPFLGYHDAPVLILMANPGSVPGDRRIDRDWVTRANQQALAAPGGTVTYSLDDKAGAFPGGIWWRGMTRGLLAPGRTYADLAARLLVVQWHGYHSAKPSLPPERLPSQDFARSGCTGYGPPGPHHHRHGRPVLAQPRARPCRLPRPDHKEVSAGHEPERAQSRSRVRDRIQNPQSMTPPCRPGLRNGDDR